MATRIVCAWPYYRARVHACARLVGATVTPHARAGCKWCTGMGANTGAGWHYQLAGTPSQLQAFAVLYRHMP